MSRPFPYSYISCPCTGTPAPDPVRKINASPRKGSTTAPQPSSDDSDEDEADFDPRAPRSNFSLYPPEQLLYCEDCHQIKCPRCITEEIVCWYCPNCLFETPSSMVRSESNRCARNCFNCPICTAPLAVSALESGSSASQQGPWVLSCGYCMWTTLDIGIKFDKPTNIRAQLSKMTSSGENYSRAGKPPGPPPLSDSKSPLSAYSSTIDDDAVNDSSQVKGDAMSAQTEEEQSPLGLEARFAALKAFYRTQLAETSVSPADPLGTDFGAGFSSPGALNRIMSIYTSSTLSGLYGGNSKKLKSKPPVMREAQRASEGLSLPAADADDAVLKRLTSGECGWDDLASIDQRSFQSSAARFVDELLPLPVLLRTKRSKRCKSCKHILVKPEFKPQSTRFRIRLIALSYIPLPTMRPLALPPAGPLPSSLSSSPSPMTSLAPDLDALTPLKPFQILLTLKNHMFDPIRVTLGTPPVTPGRVASRVTILCPQFEIGANSDVWDEALQGTASNTVEPRSAKSSAGAAAGFEKVAEAGKVWDKGRNWTTIVLEVVPGTLPACSERSTRAGTSVRPQTNKDDGGGGDDNDFELVSGDAGVHEDINPDSEADQSMGLQDDEDVLEIPVFVRMEWDADSQNDQPVGKGQKPDLVRRELAYWMVLGVGRILPPQES